MTPGQAATILAGLPIVETLSVSLAGQADALAEGVRNALGEPAGGPHDAPWRESGALQSSITAASDGLTATVSSTDPAAAPQELGTATIPPRPFLAPAAATFAEPMARAIGSALADLLADWFS